MSLSLIAEVDGTPCGSVWMTPISIGGINGYMLGPLATHPDFRKLGAGKLLAREVTARTLARGEGSFVMLVGDRDYYCPLGWEPTTLGNIEFPGPVDPERVLLFAADKSLAQTLAVYRGLSSAASNVDQQVKQCGPAKGWCFKLAFSTTYPVFACPPTIPLSTA